MLALSNINFKAAVIAKDFIATVKVLKWLVFNLYWVGLISSDKSLERLRTSVKRDIRVCRPCGSKLLQHNACE